MKKLLSIILSISMVLCFAACGNTDDSSLQENTKSYEIGNYSVELPATYEFNDLEEVKAESDCIAMLTDKDGNLPDLWVYEDKCEGSSIKEHLINIDSQWNYTEMSVYEKDGTFFAKGTFDEEWYGAELKNEVYYKLADDNKVVSFDFAYEKTDESETVHSTIEEIAEILGF